MDERELRTLIGRVKQGRLSRRAFFGRMAAVGFTVPANQRSQRVMQRLGMRHGPADDFDHPRVPAGHQLQRHVLYRLTRQEWLGRRSGAPEPGGQT